MDKMFTEYIKYSKEKIEKINSKALIVFDTSVLIDLYLAGGETVETFFSILDKIKNRIWLPYHVCEEFYSQKDMKVIASYSHKDEIDDEIKKVEEKITEIFSKIPFLKSSDIKDIEKEFSDLKKVFKTKFQKFDTNFENDSIDERLRKVFSEKIGEEISVGKLKKLEEEGKRRYELKMPPGYMDNDKNKNKYGDYIIWSEIIEKSQEINKPILFIIQECKTDWWVKSGKYKYQPQPYLKKELKEKSKQDFHMCNLNEFIDIFGKKYLVSEYTENKKLISENLRKINQMRHIKYFGSGPILNPEFVNNPEYLEICRKIRSIQEQLDYNRHLRISEPSVLTHKQNEKLFNIEKEEWLLRREYKILLSRKRYIENENLCDVDTGDETSEVVSL